MARIDEIHTKHPYMGQRKIAKMLRDDGFEIGRKLGRSYMRDMGIYPIRQDIIRNDISPIRTFWFLGCGKEKSFRFTYRSPCDCVSQLEKLGAIIAVLLHQRCIPVQRNTLSAEIFDLHTVFIRKSAFSDALAVLKLESLSCVFLSLRRHPRNPTKRLDPSHRAILKDR